MKLDRRNFLAKLGIVVPALAIAGTTGFSIMQPTTYNGELGSRLYVNFENPKVGNYSKVFIPFKGRYRGIRSIVPVDSEVSISIDRGILSINDTVESESEITVTILDCTRGIKELEVVIVMEKVY